MKTRTQQASTLPNRVAELAMALDLLSQIAEASDEADVVDRIFGLFAELCAPSRMTYMPFVDGEPGTIICAEGTSGIPHACADGPGSVPTGRLAQSSIPISIRGARQGETLFVLTLHDLRFPEYRDHYLELAGTITDVLTLAVANARVYERLARISVTDELTGIPNRRSGMDRLQEQLARAARSDAPLAVIIFDLDFFKEVNDVHGHAAGDTVLKNAALSMQAVVREYDLLARFGGEEFLVVAPDASEEEAVELANRIRTVLEASPVVVGGIEIKSTVSAGVTVATRRDTNVDEVLARADMALYDSKNAGRNTVRVR